MPSKARLVSEKEESDKWEKFGPIPKYFETHNASGNDLSTRINGKKSLLDGGLAKYDPENNAYLHPNHNQGAQENNQRQKEFRKEDALRIKKKYPELWGKRGAPKRIAQDEKLSVRTVQKYFKDFK
jgi:hypothetical protein